MHLQLKAENNAITPSHPLPPPRPPHIHAFYFGTKHTVCLEFCIGIRLNITSI